MRLVTYAGGSFVTSDRVTDALFEYAAALANADRAATVVVPAVGVDDVRMLIGPASQLMAATVDDVRSEPEGQAFITEVQSRSTALRDAAR